MSRILLVLAALGVLASSATASSTRHVTDCVRGLVRPTAITLFCADDNAALTHLSWSSWGGATAHAKGRMDYDDCKPNCAGGMVHHVPATATLSGTRTCSGKPYYSSLTVHLTHAVPSGYKRTAHYALGCPHR